MDVLKLNQATDLACAVNKAFSAKIRMGRGVRSAICLSLTRVLEH